MSWHTSLAPQRPTPRVEVAPSMVGRPGGPAGGTRDDERGRWRG